VITFPVLISTFDAKQPIKPSIKIQGWKINVRLPIPTMTTKTMPDRSSLCIF